MILYASTADSLAFFDMSKLLMGLKLVDKIKKHLEILLVTMYSPLS